MSDVAIREKPIIFSDRMVQAILGGRKTQTRRVVKSQPHESCSEGGCGWHWHPRGREAHYLWNDHLPGLLGMMSELCPYGDPRFGDRLWVREAWMPDAPRDASWPDVMFYGCKESPLDWIPERFRKPKHVLYRATWTGHSLSAWRPSIFMPRWASRITLEIVGVRVERLQDISEEDAEAEGAMASANYSARQHFARLWNDIQLSRPNKAISGLAAWAANPWVWVIEFQRIEDNR